MWWNYRVGEAFWAEREELSLERSRWSQEDNNKKNVNQEIWLTTARIDKKKQQHNFR